MAREDIAAAARDLFYEQGLATGLDEILKRADVSKPTFYHHFGSKEELESQYLTAQAEFLRTSVDRIAGKSRGRLSVHSQMDGIHPQKSQFPHFHRMPSWQFCHRSKIRTQCEGSARVWSFY